MNAATFPRILELIKAGDLTAADRLARETPGDPRPHAALGQALAARGAFAEALAHYERCCALKPDWVPVLTNRGFVLARLGRFAEAARAYARVLDLQPDHIGALESFASAQRDAGLDLAPAIAARERVTRLRPDDARAWYELGVLYRAADRFADHAAALDRAIALDPRFFPARWDRFQEPSTLVMTRDDEREFLARWIAGLEHFERDDLGDASVAAVAAPRTNFHLHYLGEPFVDLQKRYAAVVARLAHRLVTPPPATCEPGRKLRIGFASAFLRDHTVTKLFGALIERLPRERFDATLFLLDDAADATTGALRAHATAFFDGRRTAQAWADLIAAQRLDALVYLDLGMHPMAQLLAPLRLAPMQCALWGHPVTSGLQTIDFFVSADAMETDDAPAHYTERLVRLPRLGTCYARPSLATRARERAESVHYVIAQSVFKLGEIHDDVFARIAAALPDARFSLVPHQSAAIREELAARMRIAFERRGADFARQVRMLPHLAQDEFLALAASADVHLDSIGWSGGNTTLEITALDVPTVTLPGALMRSRHSAAIVRALGLEELVARDVDDYVRIAAELGRDAERRERLRATIAERKHVLFDDVGVVDAFAAFLEREARA